MVSRIRVRPAPRYINNFLCYGVKRPQWSAHNRNQSTAPARSRLNVPLYIKFYSSLLNVMLQIFNTRIPHIYTDLGDSRKKLMVYGLPEISSLKVPFVCH